MEGQPFNVGDRVLVVATHEDGTVYKIEGEGAGRRYWIDRGLTAHSFQSGRPIEYEREDEDGAFSPIGSYTADQLRLR